MLVMKKLCTAFLLLCFSILFTQQVQAENITVGIETFPAYYQGYLKALQEKHPNWVFKALHTGYDFNYAVTQESILSNRWNNKSISLSPLYWNRAWHHVFTDGQGNYAVTGGKLYQHELGWVTSSATAVNYTMEPRNFLNEETIFIFEDLKYDSNIHTLEGVERILYGTEMSTYDAETKEYTIKNIEYYDTEGNLKTYYYDADSDGEEDDTLTYAQAYIMAAKASGVNPYSLVIRTKNETGCLITSNGQICGRATNYPGYYNYYSIGAYGSNPMENGVIYAKNKNWWNPVIAIVEGAKLVIGGDYVVKGQNTPYLTRFNVSPFAYYSHFTHQYMTDLTCVYRESFQMFDTYSSTDEINRAIEFLIPVYDNMPEMPVDIYQTYKDEFEQANEEIILKQDTKLYAQIQTSSGMAKIELTQLKAGEKLRNLATSKNGMYDKVEYTKDGSKIYGYIFYNTAYTTSTKMIVAEDISLNMRTSPSVNGRYITTLSPGTIVTRIEKNSSADSTGVWDRIKTSNGTVGYVCRQYADGTVYLKQLDYIKVHSVTLNETKIVLGLNQTKQLITKILPENAEYQQVGYISSNSKVLSVDSNGLITGLSLGKSTITVTSEDMLKSSICEVEVVPCIATDKSIYEMEVGVYSEPKVNVYGIDEKYNLIYQVADEKIASIVEGKIYAKTKGETALNIYAKDITIYVEEEYIPLQTSAKIVVKENTTNPIVEEFTLDKSIKKSGNNILTGFDEKLTVKQLSELITTNMTYVVKNTENKLLLNSDIIGTGTVIEVTDSKGVKTKYTILIYGDVNGDGAITLKDALEIEKHYVKLITINGINLQAASVTNRNETILLKDSLAIKKHYVKLATITQ